MKKQQDFQKHTNLFITNYSDFDDASKVCFRQQVLQSVSPMMPASVHQSLASLVAVLPLLLVLDVVVMATPLFFIYDVQVLQTMTNHPILPIAINV